MTLVQLREKRARLATEMRTMMSTAEAENRGFSGEDLDKYNQMGDEVTRLDAAIRNAEQLAEMERRDAAANAPSAEELRDPATGELSTADVLRSAEYRDALTARMVGDELTDEQRSTLNVGTDTDGGFAVPEEWGRLREALQEGAVIREYAEVITTAGGGTLHIPFVEADAAEPGIVPEETTIPDDAEEFDELTLSAYKVAQLVKASEEMVQDALFDVPSFVGRRLGFRLGIKADRFYTVGTGSGQPQGVFTGASVGVNGAASVGYNSLIDLYHSMPTPYRKGAVFMMHDLTVAALRKLTDTTNRPLWEPSVQAGQPPLIIGVPVLTSQFAPQMGASNRSVVFANLGLGFTIRDVLGVTIKYLEERFADSDQVAWRGKLRTDSKVTDQNAVKALVQAA